jgi:Ca2+-binding RTX toxin-like protein
VSFSLAALGNVEDLTLIGSGDINATGNAGANVLTGNDGDNVLTGLGGADVLTGGLGDDTYVVDSLDTVQEDPGEGVDTVRITYNATTPTALDVADFGNVENIVIAGTGAFSLAGDGNANLLVGNASANLLQGNGGDDTLDGGAGLDTMQGGAGNDLYVLNMATDVVQEAGADTGDTVRIAFATTRATTLSVASYANIENLEVTGGGLYSLLGDGNANVLTGNASANVIDGGAGVDTMDGGRGSDVYKVDDALDVVVDSIMGAAGGVDRVEVGGTAHAYSLDTADAAAVEQL